MLAAIGLRTFSHGAFHNAGTPLDIPHSFDCAARQAAWQYGKATLPRRGDFKTLFDALQLENGCGIAAPPSADRWTPPTLPTPPVGGVYVAPNAAAGGDGSIGKPFATIQAALDQAAAMDGAATILLRAGTHVVASQLVVTAAHSHVAVQNYNGERAVISGGIALSSLAVASAWKPFDVRNASTVWNAALGQNNVFGRATARKDANGVKYLGQRDSLAACEAAAAAHNAAHYADADAGKPHAAPSGAYEYREALTVNECTVRCAAGRARNSAPPLPLRAALTPHRAAPPPRALSPHSGTTRTSPTSSGPAVATARRIAGDPRRKERSTPRGSPLARATSTSPRWGRGRRRSKASASAASARCGRSSRTATPN
jgi:hypothetical protein